MNFEYDIFQMKTPAMLQELINSDPILQDLFREFEGLENYIFQLLIDQDHLKRVLKKNIQSFQMDEQISLSREEIFVLILMMYYNLIDKKFQSEYSFYLVNMESLKNNYKNSSLVFQKLKCIKNYIRCFYQNKNIIGSQLVKFIRNTISENQFQNQLFTQSSEIPLDTNLTTSDKNEDHRNSTVVDFADQNIGGLTLDSRNCAQEEILMLIFTEALVTMLFIPPMKKNQAILIQNLIKYNHYKGYESSFQFIQQETNFRINYNILAIDAKQFTQFDNQYSDQNINRELLKCYAGFQLALKYSPSFPISTGRWGCGIFKGDPYLKLLIQLFAFALAQKQNQLKNCQIIINTVGDMQLYEFGDQLVNILKRQQNNLTYLSKLIFSIKNKEFYSSSEMISYVNTFSLDQEIKDQTCFNKIISNCHFYIIILIVLIVISLYIFGVY